MYDHQGGIIRNNFIFRDQAGDVGISVNKAKDFQILHNTVILQGTFAWNIECRFSPSQGVISYNLTDGNILARDGAQATLTGNIISAQVNWFKNLASGDLHLTNDAQSVIDHAASLAEVPDDIDGEDRNGIPDVGADELNVGIQTSRLQAMLRALLPPLVSVRCVCPGPIQQTAILPG